MTPDEHVASMSDGALVQAIETTMAGRKRTKHLLAILPAGGEDIDYVDGKLADAEQRLRELEDQLRHEADERGVETPARRP